MPGAPRTNPAVPRGAQADLATRLRRGAAALQERLDSRDTLVELIRSVHHTLEPQSAAEGLLKHVEAWFPADACAVTIEGGARLATMIAGRGRSASYAHELESVGRWVIENDGEFMSANLAADDRVSGGAAVAVAGFPLRCRAHTLGAVVVLDGAASSEPPQLPPELSSALSVVLEGPALALDTMLHLQRFEALSVTDDLTSLYNSRFLNQVLRRECKRASRSSRPVSLLFLDLDGFKSVNDRHGHLCGSRALVEAARVIRGSARETDMTARFGGDEFAVVLPETGSDGAVAVAERVRERIAAHRFLEDEGLDIRLTVSVGVATLPDAAATAEELIKAADAAMYRVKDRGKNAVILATKESK